ncbi:MAG: RagB/SusD family nutrient uptake outer membrane protein [Flavobacteriaceae bacterium]|uniref:RagB/SusD family nutrient uptake outer membrane protein n=1 Tax=Winogradskyella sp. SYSU M77433 TaxID=3042722 RepID=UPI000C48479B|nr:RagB/SusD family nutrient uptake outer membrane protein [Winogradskyella sp. SYSU M77433]MAX71462.1 RagB/SusD family nutrient uptake outer membrane protein [Flavobacteriaceae bacterium]MDH7911931.1 RagB/SusD family nutrient uptake outer membrane protein [Winogradskyella sp. SYSU M77433]
MKNLIKLFVILVVAATAFYSCTDDLNTEPKVELSLEELLSEDPNAIEGIVSRLYASFALSGPSGPGSSDVDDDPGESPFLRGIINLQDFTADGMKNRWGDDGLDQLTTTSSWDGNNKFFRYLYNRIYYTIPQCNNLISVLNSISVEDSDLARNEARFLRSLAYYYLIDTFGKGVLATENNLGESQPLPEVGRIELFNYVEGELLEIEPLMPESNGYGRANKYVVDMLLAKLYINAEVYTGEQRYDDAFTYINKVITEGGYQLTDSFVENFSADNFNSTEIIYPLIADADNSRSYGNTTYIVNGSLSSDTMPIAQFGALEGWQGHKASPAWYGLFGNSASDLANSNDERASLFWTDGHTFEMTDYREWTNGYPSIKFRNTNFEGSSTATAFSSTDFPMYRLADAYLMYAELALRGAAGSDMGLALDYVNNVRIRSGASTISSGSLTLDFILDERARELNLEGHRRTDLIRFNRFTGGNYIWPWKGNTLEGTSIPDYYNLFPIPEQARGANPNLTQNPGY